MMLRRLLSRRPAEPELIPPAQGIPQHLRDALRAVRMRRVQGVHVMRLRTFGTVMLALTAGVALLAVLLALMGGYILWLSAVGFVLASSVLYDFARKRMARQAKVPVVIPRGQAIGFPGR